MKKRIIKKYANRRLYDLKTSKTITLDDLALFIANGEEIQVIDKKTGNDITNVTLAHIIVELEKGKKSERQISDILRELIVSGSDAMSGLAQKAVNTSISIFSISKEKVKVAVDKMIEEGKVTKGQANKVVDETWNALKESRTKFTKKIKELVREKGKDFATKIELEKVAGKIDSLEKKLAKLVKKVK